MVADGGADVNVANKISKTPLMYACNERQADMVKALLKFSPDLAKGNSLHCNWTALHFAVLEDDERVVQALLEAGADPSVKDAVGRDAKQLADEHGKLRVAKLLTRRKSGADKQNG